MQSWNEVTAALRQRGIPFTCGEPLAKHTSFQIGGPAAVFCEPSSWEQLREALAVCRQAGVERYILGRGTNVLFSDDGFSGVVIHIGNALGALSYRDGVLSAQAGALLSRVCVTAARHGRAGMEFAYGIPGNVGGAVYMNAGAYGGEMRDILSAVTFLDENGEERTLGVGELALGYRTSIFEHRDWCVLSADFALAEGDGGQIRARMEEYARRRNEKQPLDLPSAGSAFKRPEGAFAGALIDQCGLRGFAVGGAQISTKHCGFIVNTGGATCRDVLELAGTVCEIVKKQTGYVLEKEIRVVQQGRSV